MLPEKMKIQKLLVHLIKTTPNTTVVVHYYVKNEELFEIIHSTHTAIGH